jgi:hypothetical protein
MSFLVSLICGVRGGGRPGGRSPASLGRMHEVPPEVLARAAVEQVAAAHGAALTSELRRDLILAIDKALRTAVQIERDACVDTCQHRRRLWEVTGDNPTTPEALRPEARARANEAAYLADALAGRAESVL